ncbi:succinylglutamate desuccinylase/aspartoacylase domain-containing protein [Marinobacterium aestuariivivens]|uniref:Succinylglutamate desuccinylase/aspartoacylase family protein n=1 Tax=Marinobacterium aestuariivivens TaxID=1698799 RepID=A0ABW2A273_9GAMM
MQDDRISIQHNPDPAGIARTPQDFLRQLDGPTLIVVDGEDNDRCRALSTLLHGNELSGLRALHGWLRRGERPRVRMLLFILSVSTALADPLFSHRQLPGERDINRCFRPPFGDRPGRVAEQLLELLEEYKPECMIDIHNTTGMNPAFGVATHEDPAHEALVALFTRRLIITDIRLGALMEISRPEFPVVTIECGGNRDPAADRLAVQGVLRYLQQDEVLQLPAAGLHLDLYHHPVRLELSPETEIRFADEPDPDADITVPRHLERYNFGQVGAGTFLFWLGPRGRSRLRLRDASGAMCCRNTSTASATASMRPSRSSFSWSPTIP